MGGHIGHIVTIAQTTPYYAAIGSFVCWRYCYQFSEPAPRQIRCTGRNFGNTAAIFNRLALECPCIQFYTSTAAAITLPDCVTVLLFIRARYNCQIPYLISNGHFRPFCSFIRHILHHLLSGHRLSTTTKPTVHRFRFPSRFAEHRYLENSAFELSVGLFQCNRTTGSCTFISEVLRARIVSSFLA